MPASSTTPRPNQMAQIVQRFAVLPAPLRVKAQSLLFGRVVRYTGTSSIQFVELSSERVIIALANKGPVQNHIGGVHAAAMALMAETATGFAVGMNLPDDKLPLLKTMTVEYKKRTKGDMRAVAVLDEAARQRLRDEPRGELTVPVTVTDASGGEPIACTFVWAWVPKKRKA